MNLVLLFAVLSILSQRVAPVCIKKTTTDSGNNAIETQSKSIGSTTLDATTTTTKATTTAETTTTTTVITTTVITTTTIEQLPILIESKIKTNFKPNN